MQSNPKQFFGRRAFLASAIWILALRAEATVSSNGITAAFGNTVTSTYPDGRTQQIWLMPGGSWTGVARNHHRLAGRWTLRGDKVCLRQKKPPTLPFSYCTAFPAKARVGDSWHSRDFVGTPIVLKLVAGQAGAVAGKN